MRYCGSDPKGAGTGTLYSGSYSVVMMGNKQ